jgi:hypothetical protein
MFPFSNSLCTTTHTYYVLLHTHIMYCCTHILCTTAHTYYVLLHIQIVYYCTSMLCLLHIHVVSYILFTTAHPYYVLLHIHIMYYCTSMFCTSTLCNNFEENWCENLCVNEVYIWETVRRMWWQKDRMFWLIFPAMSFLRCYISSSCIKYINTEDVISFVRHRGSSYSHRNSRSYVSEDQCRSYYVCSLYGNAVTSSRILDDSTHRQLHSAFLKTSMK